MKIIFYIYVYINFLTQGLAPSKCAMNCPVSVALKEEPMYESSGMWNKGE